jgi:hypothetical protein
MIEAMRLVRDLILVICAVISTACLVYLAINLDTAPMDPNDVDTSAAPADPESTVLERTERPPGK